MTEDHRPIHLLQTHKTSDRPVDFACSSTIPGEAKIPDPIVPPTMNNTAAESPMVLSSVLSFTISASVVADSGGASGSSVELAADEE